MATTAKDLTTFKIFVNGAELNTLYDVISITVSKEINKIARARVVLADGDYSEGKFKISDSADLIPGNEIEIEAGYHSENKKIYKGIIVKHAIKAREYGIPVLEIECRDESFKLSLDKKNNCFNDVTDSDIISQIISDAGLKADVKNTSTMHKLMVQYNSTDWEFILNRAANNGQYVITEGGTLKVKAPELSGTPKLDFSFGNNIIEIESEIDCRNQLKGVKSYAWAPGDQSMLEGEGQYDGGDAQGNLKATDLSSANGDIELEKKLSEHLTENEIKAWSDARLLRSRMAKIRGRVKCDGEADVNPGDVIKFTKLGDRFNGTAFVSGIKHIIESNVWVSHIQFGLDNEWPKNNEAGQASSSLIPGIQGLHTGVVVQLQDDPDGEERILVKIPVIDDQAEGTWCRMAFSDAGNERGICFLPEIDDEVIVGFINNDPRYAVILGTLHSSSFPSPIPGADDNHEKGIVTREGISMLFNDDKKSFTLETPNGNTIAITDEEGSLSILDENNNKIIMEKNLITVESAKDIEIKGQGDISIKGQNVTIEANMELKCKGKLNAEYAGDAVTALKGNPVNIN